MANKSAHALGHPTAQKVHERQNRTTYNVTSKNFIGALLGNDLDESIGVVVGLGTRVGDHGERSNVVLDTLGLAVLLGLSNPCDLGVGVDDAVRVEEGQREAHNREKPVRVDAISMTGEQNLCRLTKGWPCS